MSPSRFWMFQVVLVAWLCYSLLLVGAQTEDYITDPVEVMALKAVKKSLIDPTNNLSNWNRGDPCTSNWTGVLCYNTTVGNDYLHVRELQLFKLNLSGNLSPELGRFSHMEILDFMWNRMTGSIPKEIGNITTLKLFHMNNNSISGKIPPELSRLPSLVHFLLDNNNLSGYLPPEFSELPKLLILQVDNNHFDGSTIPASYSNMSHLSKMSLRNCGLQGPIPDLSRIPNLNYLDLSSNQLNGTIPSNKLSDNITTIILSNNNLIGPIPANFSSLPNLQRLLLANSSLNGSLPSTIWQNRTLNSTENFILDLVNNNLSTISGTLDVAANVSIRLQGNPLCSNASLDQFCGSQYQDENDTQNSTNSTGGCPNHSCPPPYEYSLSCSCALPLLIEFRLKSPGFSDFRPYKNAFEGYLTNGLNLNLYQLDIGSYVWQKGPRLKIDLKFFPVYNSTVYDFNRSEVLRIRSMFTGWTIPDSELFGPHELLGFDLLGLYTYVVGNSLKSGLSKGAIAGIVLGAIASAVTLSAIVSLLILRKHLGKHHVVSKRRRFSRITIKIDGVKDFTYGEMALATNNFSDSTQVGQGGYGKVYKGILADGTVVAIKRAQEGSLQGNKEFLTEIELLSRVHHRNLVALIGYCDEEGEQMLVYEFMSNGTLRDHLSAKAKEPLSFAMRLRIALGSAKGILYLHTEANPPIFHRDIKASNILLDSKFIAKVADFGLSRLAPVPDIEGIVPNHVSTVVKGTPGYLDPEYFLTHKLTDKSDVYSLGVVFLELLTGMHPISHGKNIVREVNIAYQSGAIFKVIDGQMGSYPSECVEKFVTLALKCCQDETDSRPSMAEVVRELENIWDMMPESNTRKMETFSIDSGKKETSPPSNVCGSVVVSGVVSTITPR